MINPSEVRFIKLGSEGEWEQDCIESSRPTIRLGFVNPFHDDCLLGKFDRVHKHWLKSTIKSKATEFTNQIRDFYTLDEKTLWITFYKRRLFWCFARPEVSILPGGERARRVKGRWRSTTLAGDELFLDRLSGRLTRTRGFRGTICRVAEADDLIRRINGEKSPDIQEAESSLQRLEQSLIPLIQHLSWQDFELLCDLIFTRAGWQRNSRVGATEEDVDLDLSAPVSGRRAFVQIKSRANALDLQDYMMRFTANGRYDEMYFVVHSPEGPLEKIKHPKQVTIVGPEKVAELVVAAGLTMWLLNKCC